MTNNELDLGKILENMGSCFNQDELAYLALTSKIEHPFRDRFAYCLYKRYPQLTVSREWNRVDLAILNDSGPEILIELKAMYSFDMFSTVKKCPNALDKNNVNSSNMIPNYNEYRTAVDNDVKKLITISEKRQPKPELFTLLLCTHPHSSLNQKIPEGVIKYKPKINGFYNNKYCIDKTIIEKVEDCFETLTNPPKHKVTVFGQIDGGTAFDIKVTLYYWLFGPY